MVAYSFKQQFIGPIRAGLGIDHLNERGKIVIPGPPPKRQTIRAVGKRRHARPGEILQLYYAQRTKQCMSIGVARCISAQEIRISIGGGNIVIAPGTEDFELVRGLKNLNEFARSDGFADWSGMQEFWRAEHGELTRLGPFVGVLVKWEPIR